MSASGLAFCRRVPVALLLTICSSISSAAFAESSGVIVECNGLRVGEGSDRGVLKERSMNARRA